MKQNPIFKFFSSLKLAVFSILLLAGVLAYATLVESDYGMRAAHIMVYGTAWFNGVLGLLGFNVLCAALSRYPWKRHQTGFVLTHLGILILLGGSFVTQRWGVDGNMPVVEKSQARDVYLSDMTLSFYDEGGTLRAEYPFPETGVRADGRLLEVKLPNDERLIVDQFLPRLLYEKAYMKSPVVGVGTPALQIKLHNDRFQVAEWLTLQHPRKPGQLNLGPAVVELSQLWSQKEVAQFLEAKPEKKKAPKSVGYVVVSQQGRNFRMDINEGLTAWRAIGDTGFEFRVEKYLPYAVVEGNKLITRSQEPKNPAVQMALRDRNGATERHTLFALYPEFNTRHLSQDRSLPPFGFDAKMVSASYEAEFGQGPRGGQGRLELAIDAEGKSLYYRSFGKAGDLKGKGKVEPGKETETGWMDLKFTIADFLPFAVENEEPRYVEFISGQDGSYLSGLRYRLVQGREVSNADPRWLMEGQTAPIAVGGENWVVQYSKQKIKLPFHLYLEKFTIGTDPGTQKAASYQSEVLVKDGQNGGEKPSLISMNEPLKYGGYTFYQASYQMEEGRPPISIFSVNVDPGRWIKYLGSIVMVFGIGLMFYMNPHYWGIILGRRKSESNAH